MLTLKKWEEIYQQLLNEIEDKEDEMCSEKILQITIANPDMINAFLQKEWGLQIQKTFLKKINKLIVANQEESIR